MAEAARLELDPARIAAGADLIERLALRGVGVSLAAWVRLRSVGEWRLKLVAPAIESQGRRGLLGLAREILAGMPGAPFDEYDVDFEAPDDPVYAALGRHGTGTVRTVVPGPLEVDGIGPDAAYLYFADPETPAATGAADRAKARSRIKA